MQREQRLAEPVASTQHTRSHSIDKHPSTCGFPPGYFVIRNIASNRLLDVTEDMVEDGTPIILYPETETSLVEDMRKPESNNQVFFIDASGALCSRSSGHAIDVEAEGLVLRHRRPVSHPFPNAYSHPLPRFTYNHSTGCIGVTFGGDPTYPTIRDGNLNVTWQNKTYVLAEIPLRKPRTIMDNATALLSAAITMPLALFGASKTPTATPEAVFSSGDIDLKEDEILEQERSEEGEVDDSPEKIRQVRVVGFTNEDEKTFSESAKWRWRWQVTALRSTKNRTGV